MKPKLEALAELNARVVKLKATSAHILSVARSRLSAHLASKERIADGDARAYAEALAQWEQTRIMLAAELRRATNESCVGELDLDSTTGPLLKEALATLEKRFKAIPKQAATPCAIGSGLFGTVDADAIAAMLVEARERVIEWPDFWSSQRIIALLSKIDGHLQEAERALRPVAPVEVTRTSVPLRPPPTWRSRDAQRKVIA